MKNCLPGSAPLSGARIRCGLSSVLRQRLLAVIRAGLLNHLIRLDQHALWYHKADLLSRRKVDENLEF